MERQIREVIHMRCAPQVTVACACVTALRASARPKATPSPYHRLSRHEGAHGYSATVTPVSQAGVVVVGMAPAMRETFFIIDTTRRVYR